MTYLVIVIFQVAAENVQVLNSVKMKLPFLVTTADDAKETAKEEIRLRYWVRVVIHCEVLDLNSLDCVIAFIIHKILHIHPL